MVILLVSYSIIIRIGDGKRMIDKLHNYLKDAHSDISTCNLWMVTE